MQFPLMLLGYGDYNRTKKLLSVVEPQQGLKVLPLFTDPQPAEQYRHHMQQLLLQATLPIAVSGPVGTDSTDYLSDNRLNLLVLAERKQAVELLELLVIMGQISYAVLDPQPDQPLPELLELDQLLDRWRAR